MSNTETLMLQKVKPGGFYIIEDIIHKDFDYKLLDYKLLRNKEYRYIRVPNVLNPTDNNLFIVKC